MASFPTMLNHEKIVPQFQGWQERLWLLIALSTPLFVNLWVEQQFEASKLWLLRTLIWLLAALWLNSWAAGQRIKFPPSPIRNSLSALVLILGLSTILSTNPSIAFFGTLDRANGLLTQISYLLLFLCVATRIDSLQSARLLHAIILTAVPIGVLGIAQLAGWHLLPIATDARSALVTTLGRANFTGAYLALLLPLTLAALLVCRGWWPRVGYTLLIALELVIIILTEARAAWIAAFVGAGIFLWLQLAPRWSLRARWLSALGGLVGLAGLLFLMLQRGISNGGSIAARWTIWQTALGLLWPRLWLGYGADTLELHFPAVYPPQLVYYQGRGVVVDRAHNWLLDWSLNYGVVATVLLMALLFFVLQQGWQQITTSRADTLRPLPGESLDSRWLGGCMAAICAQLVGNLFLFEVASTAVVFWLLMAILTAVAHPRAAETAGRSLPIWVNKIGVVVTLCILSWALWHGNVRPLLADLYNWRGTQRLSQGEIGDALMNYATAVHYQPKRAAYHVATALTAAQLDRLHQARESMRRAIELRPTDPVLYSHLAAIYARAAPGSPQALAKSYQAHEQAIRLAPTIALSYQQYADVALRFGDAERALLLAQQAIDLDATDGFAFGILGWAHLQSGNLDAALAAFQQAVKWQPESADFYLGLATTHALQGNLAAAREFLQQSLRLDPTYAPALTLELQLQE